MILSQVVENKAEIAVWLKGKKREEQLDALILDFCFRINLLVLWDLPISLHINKTAEHSFFRWNLCFCCPMLTNINPTFHLE